MRVTKAVIPAAGMGTRFLPVIKGVPKEMLAIVDKPAIQYIVEECAASGITDVLIIINHGKEAVEHYFGANPLYDGLCDRTLLKGLDDLLEKVKISFTYQEYLNGTGGALMLAREFTGDEPFAVLFGDDVVINEENPCIGQLIKAYGQKDTIILGVQECPREEAVNYGVIDKGASDGRFTEIKNIVEKPPLEKLPSTLCSLGRYILKPDIYDALEKTRPVGRELFLPNAIDYLIKKEGAYAYTFEGRRYDIGNKLGFMEANIEMGLKRFGPDFQKIIDNLATKKE